MYLRLESALLGYLHRPQSVPRVCALAALIMVPTLFAGFFLDDYIHLLTLRGEGTVAQPYDIFEFAPGDADVLFPMMNSGPYPWYTLPDLKLHFFRPLSSATMVLDHALFGEGAFFYHVHSLVWYVLLVGAVFLLFRRTMAPAMAGLCCIIYLVDDGHILPALWWSNRNAIVAAAPALLGLLAHMRAREDHWVPGRPLALLGFGLGLLGGETALGIFGYLIAYELVGRQDALWLRIRALVPAGLLALGYLAVYKTANYGVFGSGVYLDPLAEGGAFLRALPIRLADLIGIQFFALPSELTVVSNAVRVPLLLAALVCTGVVVLGFALLWRRCDPDERRLLLWMGLGSFIATLPVLATFPSGRLLLLPSIGGAVWIGFIIAKGLDVARDPASSVLRLLGRVFLFLHILLPPVIWLALSMVIPTIIFFSKDAFHEMDLPKESLPEQQAICLFAPDPYTGFYPLMMRQYLGYPVLKGWQTLSIAPFDHEVTRTGPNDFEVRILKGELLSTPFERLLRSENYPFEPGDMVNLDGFSIEVLEVGTWGPHRFHLHFDHPLEYEGYRFLAWQEGRLSRLTWPPLGETKIFRASGGYFSWPNFKKRLPLL